MRFLFIYLICFLLLGCVSVPEPSARIIIPTKTATTPPPTPTATPPPMSAALSGDDPVLVGAGDIGDCNDDGDEATSALLDGISGTVFTLGDNAYPEGSTDDFLNCYDPSWGRHKTRTYPAIGNHDDLTTNAAGYFNYFGAIAGEFGKGYYSYDLGTWHIIVLNSNIQVNEGSEQEQWLRADLAAHPVACTLAYWHRPRFSSGDIHGSSERIEALWQALYDYGADVVLAGHEHNYERFAPQDPQGNADPIRGIRQFVVGTGGVGHYSITTPIANSEVHNTDTFGVLKLVLHPGSYSWEFIPVAGMTFSDAGTASCVTSETLASNDILVFTPIGDATVKSDSPDTNYGDASELQVDNNPYDNFLVKFNVTGINNRSVLSAKLRLFNVNSSDMGGDIFYSADNEWSESNVTWNTAPLAGSTPVGSLGPVSNDTWYEIDLTSHVIKDGVYTLRVSTSSGNGADYASKEGEAGLAPKLIVSLGESGTP